MTQSLRTDGDVQALFKLCVENLERHRSAALRAEIDTEVVWVVAASRTVVLCVPRSADKSGGCALYNYGDGNGKNNDGRDDCDGGCENRKDGTIDGFGGVDECRYPGRENREIGRQSARDDHETVAIWGISEHEHCIHLLTLRPLATSCIKGDLETQYV